MSGFREVGSSMYFLKFLLIPEYSETTYVSKMHIYLVWIFGAEDH